MTAVGGIAFDHYREERSDEAVHSLTGDEMYCLAGEEERPERSASLPLLWHCDFRSFSSKTPAVALFGNEPSMVLAETRASVTKGLAMSIRSTGFGVRGGEAHAARSLAIPAGLPSTLLGGLLLLICP
jgi:hypothetical protein